MNKTKTFLCLLFFSIVLGILFLNRSITKVAQTNDSIQLYSNHVNDDLKNVFLNAILSAKHSIYLKIYSLTDEKIIQAINAQSEKVAITIVYDKNASKGIRSKLNNNIKTHAVKSIGLMHQKILIIDDDEVFLGSANMTSESLRMHGNLVLSFHSKEVANHVTLSTNQNPFSCDLNNQPIEFWQLPDVKASDKLIQMINTAQKSICIAMFTWSHHDLAKAVINAHNKGIKVSAIIDNNSAKGASNKIAKMLAENGVLVKTNQSIGLLHHKFLLIDEEILINGSANWTQAAFTKNSDCFMIMHSLTATQKEKMKSIWNIISIEAVPFIN